MRTYDVTLPLRSSLAGFPGEQPFRFEYTSSLDGGARVNVGAATMSTHAGTHVDAPHHFDGSGATVELLDLAALIGPAVVVDVRGYDPFGAEVFRSIDITTTPRVLFRTGAWMDPDIFPAQVPTMAPDVPSILAARGAVLVGVDVPSVDRVDSKELPNHRELTRHGIHIVESLCLAGVPEGTYEFIALPLKIVGADAAPIRALLRETPACSRAHATHDAITGVSELALWTQDLSRAVSFYRDVLGFTIREIEPEHNAFLTSGGILLVLFRADAPGTTLSEQYLSRKGGPRGAVYHVGMQVDPSGLDTLAERARRAGAAVEGPVTFPTGRRSYFLEDPDEHHIELTDR